MDHYVVTVKRASIIYCREIHGGKNKFFVHKMDFREINTNCPGNNWININYVTFFKKTHIFTIGRDFRTFLLQNTSWFPDEWRCSKYLKLSLKFVMF